ncbi:TPA: hypothetical protein DCP13_00540 [Candidatus Azambacteria bacterium]|nr:hypothetical protein [Candidatus Azambacteria bacterium]
MKTAIKNINRNNKKPAAVMLPLTAFRYLCGVATGKKLVVELDVDSLKNVNKTSTIDEMVAEARLEYFSGKTKCFADTKKLMNYLNA